MNLVFLFLWHLWLCLQASADDGAPSRHPYNKAIDNGTYGYYPINTYATDEDLTSPKTNWLQWSEQCDDGLLYFITPRGWGLPRPGPMILDKYGDLIWHKHFDNLFGGQAYDFMVQTYQGVDYLTFWLGDDRVRGHGSGFYYMLNSSYDIVHKVGAAEGLSADLHEFLITPEGTALMTMYQIVPHDVSPFRDFDPENPNDQNPNYIWDCVFQEVSVDTGDLVFEWRASDHLNINSTYHEIGPGGTKSDPFDWFHINSIEKDELGNYLVSARYTHSITYVHGKTGEIIWTLGGRLNNFLDLSGGDGINFAWQHDARFLQLDAFPNSYTPPKEKPGCVTKLLTFFDNAAEDQHYEYGLPISRGLLLELTYPDPEAGAATQRVPGSDLRDRGGNGGNGGDLNVIKVEAINGTDPKYTVRVVKSYENPQKIRSSSQGSLQILPQGAGEDPKVFVGYGLNAAWTEFDANGTVLCDVHFGATTSWERGDIQSYRAYKFAWTGYPRVPPEFTISDDEVEVYMSWNGASEIAEWVLQCSEVEDEDDSNWQDIARVPKDGFETMIPIPDKEIGSSRFLRAVALDDSGSVLPYGRSDPVDRGYMAAYFPAVKSSLPQEVAEASGVKVFMILVCNVSLLCVLYEIYRRYLSWRYGRPYAGPLRFRKGALYQLLHEA